MINKMTQTQFEDYVNLGQDIDELFIDNAVVSIDGTMYETPEQLKDVLNELSNGGLYCSTGDNKTNTDGDDIHETKPTIDGLITCEDVLNMIYKTK